MNKNPFFSIIMPVYNTEKTLSASIGSILTQTFTDRKPIIVENESPNKIFDIVKAYETAFLPSCMCFVPRANLNDHMNRAALLSDSLLRSLCEQPLRYSEKAQSLIIRLADQIKQMNALGKAPSRLVGK